MAKIICADILVALRTLPDNSVNCCVTSPPYYGLRDYGHDDQIGLEKSPELYVDRMVDIFSEVHRVLKRDGTFWLNIGDSYAGSGKGAWGKTDAQKEVYIAKPGGKEASMPKTFKELGIKQKDLIGIPWMLAFALRKFGWYLRSDIIWNKPNAMPSSVKDRCSSSYEHIFMFAKSQKYYYDDESIKEPCVWDTGGLTEKRSERAKEGHKSNPTALRNGIRPRKQDMIGKSNYTGFNARYNPVAMRNKRDVWNISTKPFKGAHFATFPPDLIKPMILAGCPEGGVVLDPFFGSGTVGLVCNDTRRDYIGIDLNIDYCKMAADRIGYKGEIQVIS